MPPCCIVYPVSCSIFAEDLKQVVMKKWEKELRARLEKELPDKPYNISSPGFCLYTGKLGYIDMMVEVYKQVGVLPAIDDEEGV